MAREELQELISLLSENDNIIKAQKIAENWIHIKWHTEYDFWNEFENIISKEYEILDYQKYSNKSLDSVIHYSKNKNAWFGLMFKIAEFKSAEVCLFIERGWLDIYYGITLKINDNREINTDAEYDELANQIKPYFKYRRDDYWLGRNDLSPEINFALFNSENTLSLVNKEVREKYIYENWLRIKETIDDVKKEIEKL
ncbi:MAG: hypothetical protein U5L09_01810 [Bacteroidales bacterium]|nr:hypothetical protein [Bacteroidales bacterium]